MIVIDFLCLGNCVVLNAYDSICGGGYVEMMRTWKAIFDALEATGCTLVFYSDMGVREGKIDEWLRRRNSEFKTNHAEFYDWLADGKTPKEIEEEMEISYSMCNGLESMARKYGEFRYSILHECDIELAQYAKQHNAIAILSNDTDFLIFDGPWNLWSSQEMEITSNCIKTIEFKKNCIQNVCSIRQYQLPLFATLLGNDFTHGFYDELGAFFNSMGPLYFRFQNVARYVRKVCKLQLSNEDIKQIAQHAFGRNDIEIQQLIWNSIYSYKIDIPLPIIIDPLQLKFLNTKIYEMYTVNMGNIVENNLSPDLFTCSETNFPLTIIDWVKRSIGIIRQRFKDHTFTFTLLAKKNIQEDYMAHTEAPIYPDCKCVCKLLF